MQATSVTDDMVLRLALEKGLLQPAQIAAAGATVQAGGAAGPQGLLAAVTAAGDLDARQAAGLLGEALGMPTVELAALRVPGHVLGLLPRSTLARYRIFPFAREGNMLRVAVSDPLDSDGIDTIGHLLKLTVEASVTTEADISRAIDRYHGSGEALDPAESGRAGQPEREQRGAPGAVAVDESAETGDAPIIRLVQSIILDAAQRRASDIHMEPLERRLRVRYRIDGVLVEAENPPKRLQLSIISRLKIMANISIAEKRLPQDGRIQIAFGGKSLDLRVSSLPTAHGESIVMRILDKEGLQLGLPELGFLGDDQTAFEKLITLPDGMILVTGPTGSGKTTTLYSCLHFLNKPDRKIITVEDPVEYQLGGINQVPVRPEVGMTFASALRAMLRQAPNIVMVGEIRDLETAEIAINASLTGHLVFSTLHTNDAPGAVTRLVDLGVKPFLVSTSLRAVVAQRLVRRICPHCRRPHRPGAKELALLHISAQQAAGANFMHGAGCPLCHGTGFRGRMGIFEILVVDDEIQRMIYDGAGTSALRGRARALGMRTMREDGSRKVISGLTTADEVASITVGDVS